MWFNGVTFGYDGEGRRVSRTAGGATTVYVYDASGELAAEYGPAAVNASTAVYYVTAEQLGSTRMVTDGGGVVKQRMDYRPFGDEILVSSGNPRYGIAEYGADAGVRQKFTGKERDAETGLDYFGARYYSGAQGRFTSPDKPFADQHVENPQTWNLYAYGRNNPLFYVVNSWCKGKAHALDSRSGSGTLDNRQGARYTGASRQQRSGQLGDGWRSRLHQIRRAGRRAPC